MSRKENRTLIKLKCAKRIKILFHRNISILPRYCLTVFCHFRYISLSSCDIMESGKDLCSFNSVSVNSYYYHRMCIVSFFECKTNNEIKFKALQILTSDFHTRKTFKKNQLIILTCNLISHFTMQ